MHLTFQDCVNVIASNLKGIAPENSPNTDGIHVTGTQNIQIMSSLIRTGKGKDAMQAWILSSIIAFYPCYSNRLGERLWSIPDSVS